MPIRCHTGGCGSIASIRKSCCGESYCNIHASSPYHAMICPRVNQAPADPGATAAKHNHPSPLIEKLDSVMLKLPATKAGSTDAPPRPLRGKAAVTADRARLVMSAFDQFLRWWPCMVTALRVAGVVVFAACMTNLPSESILLYGCIKAPLLLAGSTKSAKGTVDGAVTAVPGYWYHPCCVAGVFALCLACDLQWPSGSRWGLLASSQHAVISLWEHRRRKTPPKGPTALTTARGGANNLMINQGVKMARQAVTRRASTYADLCLDVMCCFIAPAAVCDLSHLRPHAVFGVLCATALY